MIVSIATLSITTFQLTHSRGVRPSLRALRSVQPYFNSRTHVECDLPVVPTTENKEISTHALTWSATSNTHQKIIPVEFQLTHSRGVRRTFHMYNFHHFPFQLTHSRGVRPLAICFIL